MSSNEPAARPETTEAVEAYPMPCKNLYETLVATARRLPEKCALICDGKSVAYSALLKQTDCLAAYLAHTCGVAAGDRVGLMMTNSIPFCVAFYAILKLGAVVSVVNTKLQSAEIAYIFQETQPRVICADALWAEKLEKAMDGIEVRKVLWNGAAPENGFGGKATFANLPEGTCQAAQVGTDDPAVIMYTSGTTGTPKGAVLTHGNILQNVAAYRAILNLDENERTLLAVPAFHVTGLSCILALFVTIGGLLVLMPFFKADAALSLLREYRITHFHAVPTVYILLSAAAANGETLDDLQTVVCGGGFITHDDIHRFCRIAPNVSFHPAYGMTETAGAGVLFPGDYNRTSKPLSAGKGMPNVGIRIVDGQGNPVGVNEVGQICFRGPTVIGNYWNRAESDSFQDGWLLSGDVGRLDEDGYLYVLDRIKDSINRGGEKIYSLAVEKEIRHCRGVRQAAVFAVPDRVYGEVAGAAVVRQQGATVTEQEIREQLAHRMAKYKIPQYWEFWDALPCTASGKVKKYELRRIFTEKYSRQTDEDRR